MKQGAVSHRPLRTRVGPPIVQFGKAERVLRMKLGVTLVAAALSLGLLLPTLAEAMVRGAPAQPADAPWAVKISLFKSGTAPSGCSGALVGPGLIVTAAHCLYADSCRQNSTRWTHYALTYSNGHTVLIRNPRRTRLASYRGCRYSRGRALPNLYDIAIVRDIPNGLPTLPLASPSEAGSLLGRGVTYFAAGVRTRYSNGRFSDVTDRPTWVDKSPDHTWNLVRRRHCPRVPIRNFCFHRTTSSFFAAPGDSGAPLVGWVAGGWRLLAVVSGYSSDSNHDPGEIFGQAVTAGVSRRFLDRHIASTQR